MVFPLPGGPLTTINVGRCAALLSEPALKRLLPRPLPYTVVTAAHDAEEGRDRADRRAECGRDRGPWDIFVSGAGRAEESRAGEHVDDCDRNIDHETPGTHFCWDRQCERGTEEPADGEQPQELAPATEASEDRTGCGCGGDRCVDDHDDRRRCHCHRAYGGTDSGIGPDDHGDGDEPATEAEQHRGQADEDADKDKHKNRH